MKARSLAERQLKSSIEKEEATEEILKKQERYTFVSGQYDYKMVLDSAAKQEWEAEQKQQQEQQQEQQQQQLQQAAASASALAAARADSKEEKRTRIGSHPLSSHRWLSILDVTQCY